MSWSLQMNCVPYCKWTNGGFPRRPGTTSPVNRETTSVQHEVSFFSHLMWNLMHVIFHQVIIWWGVSPCSRVQMSRRSVTLEDMSSCVWARPRSYAPPRKYTAHESAFRTAVHSCGSKRMNHTSGDEVLSWVCQGHFVRYFIVVYVWTHTAECLLANQPVIFHLMCLYCPLAVA